MTPSIIRRIIAGVSGCWGAWVSKRLHPFTPHPLTPAMLLACAIFLSISGCAPYLQAQTDLVAQSRKGIAMISTSLAAQQKTIEQYQRLQRRQLDEAFDADVREQSALTPQWVIDHRRAYVMAIDASRASIVPTCTPAARHTFPSSAAAA